MNLEQNSPDKLQSPASSDTTPNQTKNWQFGKADLLALIIVFILGVGPGLLIVGIYYFINGYRKHIRNMLIASIIMIIVGIASIGAIVANVYYIFNEWGKASQVTTPQTAVRSDSSRITNVTVGDKIIEIELPKDVKKIESTNDFTAYGAASSNAPSGYTGQISLQLLSNYSAGSANPEAFIQTQKYQQETITKIKEYCPTPTTELPVKRNVTGGDMTYSTAFTCPMQSNQFEYRGHVIDIFVRTNVYRVIIVAERDMQNDPSWEQALNSLKLL